MFRPVLGQYSVISIQKRYKGRCNKNARCHLFAVAIFIMFKYKSIIIIIRPIKFSLFCDKHKELASINITTTLFYTLKKNNIFFYLYNM